MTTSLVFVNHLLRNPKRCILKHSKTRETGFHKREEYSLNDGLLTSILPNRAHGLAVRAVTVHRVNMHICGVRLGAEAVIADVHPRPLDGKVLDVKRVEEVGILWQSARVVGLSGDDHIAICHS